MRGNSKKSTIKCVAKGENVELGEDGWGCENAKEKKYDEYVIKVGD